jgi:adenylate kinase
MQVIIFGPPGVGKGTQSLLIAEKLGLVHLSTGEILRNAVENGTKLGLAAKEVMEAGILVSDEIMVGIIEEELASREMREKGFILDGFPRTLNQAVKLEGILEELQFNDIRIINILVDEEEIIKRLMGRGRKDDTEDIIRHRLQVYREQTAPVRDYFSKKYKIIDIQGVGDIAEINSNIIRALGGEKVNTSKQV